MKWVCFFYLLLSIFNSDGKESLHKLFYENAVKCIEEGKLDSASYLFDQIRKTKKAEGTYSAGNAFAIGQVYRSYSLYEQAAVYLIEALEKIDSIQNPTEYIDIRNEIGLLHYDQHHYTRALAEFSFVLGLSTELKDTFGLAFASINIGNVFKQTEDFEIALNYYQDGLEYSEMLGSSALGSIALNNIGSVYYLQKKTQRAQMVFENALQITNSQLNGTNLAHVQVNLGLCKFDLEEYELARDYFELSLSNYDQSDNKEGMFLCYVNLFNVANCLGNEAMAANYKSLALKKEYEDCDIKARVDLYTYLQDSYIQKGDSTAALLYTIELLNLNVEIVENLKNEQLTQLKTDVNFIQVSNELNEAQQNLERETEAKAAMTILNDELRTQNRLNLTLSFTGLLLFIGLIFILYHANRRKRKNNLILTAQKKIVEEKNVEILNSLNYANSMEKLLLQQMNPHFLYNALTTIEASISVGDTKFAKDYLILFSDLLRKTLDNSRKDAISLEQEIEFLKTYINLNAVKQGGQFTYDFDYIQDEVEDFVLTPPMLVQPFIENALIHGLYHKTNGPKRLTIQVQPKSNHIIWTIIDNGIGRERSHQIGKTHKGISHGIKITVDRIHWMKKRYGNDFSMEYIDLKEGTKVILKTPILDESIM